MGWVGGRWLSPKASAGVAGGECVVGGGGGVSVPVCVCVCAGFLLGRTDGGALVQKNFFWSRREKRGRESHTLCFKPTCGSVLKQLFIVLYHWFLPFIYFWVLQRDIAY